MPSLPWYARALLAGAAAAAVGWLLTAGLVFIAWLTAQAGTWKAALSTGTQFWFLAHGGGLAVGEQHWTLVPLGVSIMLGLLAGIASNWQARRALAQERDAGHAPDQRALGRLARNVAALVSLGYAGTVTLVATIVGSSTQGVRTLIGSAILALVATTIGAIRGTGYRPTRTLPAWARPVPAAVRTALVTMAAVGAAVLAVGLVRGLSKVSEITASLAVDGVTGAALVLLQLAFAPNLILWSGSWALGAGFSLGDGTLVAPTGTSLGLLPAVPVFGALPAEGPGAWVTLSWLASGLLAGALAAVLMMRRRPRARVEESVLVGGLSGVLAGLAYTGLAVLSGGDLGSGRMSGLGPRPVELLVMSTVLMGLAGMATGLIWGLIRRAKR